MRKTNNLIYGLAFALSLLFYGITAQAAVVDLTNTTTFPDPAFRTALQQALGANSVEATSVTSLDVSNKGITNLTGIAKFTNLETLNIANNNLSAAPDFSNNKAIKYLDMTNSGVIGNQGSGVNKTVTIPQLVNLETLILANNPNVTCVNVSNATNLKYLDLSNTDLYFQNRQIAYGYFSQANKNTLETFLADNCNWVTAGDISGFQNLKTVVISNNKFSHQNFVNCPKLESVDVSGNTSITSLSITNSSLEQLPQINATGCTNLTSLTLDANNFNTLPEIPISTVKYLSMKNNAFPVNYTIEDNTQFIGIDLGNNPFQSLTVKNSALSALSLAGNTNLTELHLHGNANLKKTASDEGVSAAQGLYIKGLANLETLDIENSSFEELGQSNSTQGCSGIKTLKAAHNKFTTFSNAYTSFSASSRTKDESRSSLEHLTGLEYLDLSNNLLQDSLHLFQNTQLKTLIVRNNRTITEYSDNSVVNKKFHTPGDVGEFNDTIGLRMINLLYNPNLEYLDISYTNIHHFAKDGRKDNFKEDYYMANFATKATETAKNREPHYILVTNCNKLKEFYADYNGMKSAAFIPNNEGHYFPDLKRISMIETRGQDPHTMQGSWNPNGSGGCPNLEYINVANSDLDSIGVTNNKHLKYLNVSGNWTKNNWSHWSSNGVGHTLNLKGCDALVECVADDCPHLVIAQANDKTNLTSLSLNNNPELKQVYVPNTGLARIDKGAYNRADDGDSRSQQAQGNLGLAGLNTAANLELLYCEDNAHLTSLDVTANSNLKYLHAYNNKYGVSGLDLSHNNGLVTAWVSNSEIKSLNLDGCVVLDTLKCYDNATLAELYVDDATNNLRYLDLARCHVGDLDVSKNTALEYFDCSNDEKCDAKQGNWISDLNFTSTALKEVYANNNNLYCIKLPTSLPSLTNIEYEHNHINGIDLSGAPDGVTIKDQDNGRTIVAECANWKKQDKSATKLFYFQLTPNAGDNTSTTYNTYLASKTSKDELKPTEEYTRESLNADGFVVDKAIEWTTGVSGVVNGTKKKAATISDMTPDQIVGNIVVLIPTEEPAGGKASGHAEYTYNNGKGNSTFYLDWTADSQVITCVDDLNASAEVASVTYYNLAGVASQEPFDGVNLVVKTMTDGSTVTTKMIK